MPALTLAKAPRRLAPSTSGLGYNLAGIAALILLLAVGMAYLIDQAGRGTKPVEPALGDGEAVMQTVAGQDLAIPQRWFRFGEQMKAGFAGQVDLRFNLDLGEAAVPVDVTLLPRSRARASATLLDTVYLHQFADEDVGGVPGLVGKPLDDENGYVGETVWYDPLSPAPFVAKCAQPIEPSGRQTCLRTIHLANGLAAILSFEASVLPAWKQFDEELALWLGQIGAL